MDTVEDSNRSSLPGVLASDGSDRPVGLLALAIEHPVPCNDCGSSFWPDWTLLPHAVFNAVCPDGGYLCLPCSARRVIDKERLMTINIEGGICGQIAPYATPAGNPVACAWPKDHDKGMAHSWADLPTVLVTNNGAAYEVEPAWTETVLTEQRQRHCRWCFGKVRLVLTEWPGRWFTTRFVHDGPYAGWGEHRAEALDRG